MRDRCVSSSSHSIRYVLLSLLVFQIGDLLKDWRRVNVSFTRARFKLIIIGSRKTLQSAPLLGEFFQLMDERGWILALPPKAETFHEHLNSPSQYRATPSDTAGEATSTPRKRLADDHGELGHDADTSRTPTKRARKSGVSEEALLRGRPILKDLMNETRGAGEDRSSISKTSS